MSYEHWCHCRHTKLGAHKQRWIQPPLLQARQEDVDLGMNNQIYGSSQEPYDLFSHRFDILVDFLRHIVPDLALSLVCSVGHWRDQHSEGLMWTELFAWEASFFVGG